MKQTLLSFLLALLPIVASADAVEIDGIYYNLVSKAKKAEVTTNPNKYTGDVVIPKSVTYADVEYSVTSIGKSAFSECSGLTSVFIPNSVTAIGSFVFSGSSGLTSVTIPNSVTAIGESAFYGCSGLTSVTIPNSVTSIEKATFYGCSGLTSVTIPNSVTSIGSSAFHGCRGLTSATIPNSVTSIGSYAFRDCSSLTSMTIPNSVTAIDEYAFQYCSGLTSVTIPNSVTYIGSYAFSFCSGLTSVSIPNSVYTIAIGAFKNCSGLTTITLGSGVASILEKAFASCPELTDVYCYAENVPSTNSNAFEGSLIEYARLHVLESSIETYRNAVPWRIFGEIIKLTDTNNYFEMAVTVNNAHGTVTFGDSSLTDGTQTYNVKEGSDVMLTLTADDGYRLASVKVDGVDKTADVVEDVLTISNVTADLTVNVNFITAGETVVVTIGEVGMATFCSTKDLDFSEVDGLSAYTGAGFNRETGVLTMLKVTDAPAGTGLIVKGSEGTYEVPVKTSASVYANLLVGVTEETTLAQTAGGYVNYILVNGSHGVGFYLVDGVGSLAAGKAYLRLPAAVAGSSRAIAIEFAEDATGIEGISEDSKTTTDEWRDLQGRRIAKPAKAGIYLNNGRKIVVK